MNFTAYFDESGTHADSDDIVVAGYISTPALWESFAVEWGTALISYELPSFHMNEFAHSRKLFAGWSESRRRDCFARLAAIIEKHALGSVGTAFSRRDYEVVFGRDESIFVGGPYGLAATMTFMALGSMLNNVGVFGWINYVFERGSAGKGQIMRMFDENARSPQQKQQMRLLSLSFGSKENFVPLQAADIVAYELYQQLPRVTGKDARPSRATLRLLSGVPRSWARVDRVELEKFAHVVSVRLQLAPDQLLGPLPAAPDGPIQLPISVDDFKDRWRWWEQFNGRDQDRSEVTA